MNYSIMALAAAAFVLFSAGVLYLIQPANPPKVKLDKAKLNFDRVKRTEKLREFMEAL